MRLAVLGGGGRTGREVLRLARTRDMRGSNWRGGLETVEGVEVLLGDA